MLENEVFPISGQRGSPVPAPRVSMWVMKRPTILDVARASGVAKSTVSVVLNSTPAADRVPEETRQRVRDAATQLGYSASWRARALAAQRTNMVGVVYTPPMPLIARGNYEGILTGLNDVLAARGYNLLLMPLGPDPAKWRVLLDQRIDGAIVLSHLYPQLAEIVVGSGIPTALINADTTEDVPMVLADEYGGSRQTMRYLFSLGHRRVAFLLGSQPHHYSVEQRVGGYRDAMVEAGHGGLVRVFDAEGPAECAAALAAEPKETRPTAVVCYTHYIAIKFLQELWARGLSVPGDLSVTAFSNAFPVADVIPPLTTVALATEKMGRLGAEMVIEQIEAKGSGQRRKVVLETELIVRRSAGAPPV